MSADPIRDSGKFLGIPGDMGEEMRFSMEPIVRRCDQSVFAYELLYRGPLPREFKDIDARLVDYLGSARAGLPTLFVNLSNDTLATACDDSLVRASRHADVYFELSERRMAPSVFERITRRVDALSRRGVRFALDDFGSGHDGLSRLMAMDCVSVIKLDGALIERARSRPRAAQMLRALCRTWRASGIRTVAECIEGAGQLQIADYLDVDMLQGHLLNSASKSGARRLPAHSA
ncbi:MAG: EAL domain-containing protein [Burkholderiaceae bacterium]